MTDDECRREFERWYRENVSTCFVEGQAEYHRAHAVFGEDVWNAYQAAWNNRTASEGVDVSGHERQAHRAESLQRAQDKLAQGVNEAISIAALGAMNIVKKG